MPRRRDAGPLPPVAFVLLVALLGCSAQSPFVRNNPVVRWLYYPSSVDGMERGIGPDTPGRRFDHSRYAALLARYVDDDGWVDYVGLESRTADLDAYLDEIARCDRASLSRYEDLALLLNAYNACTLKLILEHPGIKSIQDIASGDRWNDERWVIGGETVSLDDLEHRLIREGFTEPRIHFALVCASRSCPKLRNEPYVGDRLLDQLDDQARHFFAQTRNFELVPEERIANLSEIFDWFRSDFTADGSTLLEYVGRHADSEIAHRLRFAHPRTEVEFIPYDWSLNGTWR